MKESDKHEPGVKEDSDDQLEAVENDCDESSDETSLLTSMKPLTVAVLNNDIETVKTLVQQVWSGYFNFIWQQLTKWQCFYF